MLQLKETAKSRGIELQFRNAEYVYRRALAEHPVAFISYDSRDREIIARKIAVGLQRMICPVWYDEFSLRVGANLRESIEHGLKRCRRCVLIISRNFISNSGWTKREFESVFTREILENEALILPVWYGVTKEDVYEYSPSLLNKKTLSWDDLGEEEVVRQLYGAIVK